MGTEITPNLFENDTDTPLEVRPLDTAAIAAAGDRRAYDPNERKSTADQEQRGNTYIESELGESEVAAIDLAVAAGLKGPALARAVMEAHKKTTVEDAPKPQPTGPNSPTIGAIRQQRQAS